LHKRENKKLGTLVRQQYDLIFLALPAILVTIVFHYIPIYGITIAFQDYNPWDGYFSSEWVGLKHFIRFFNDPLAMRTFKNTVILGTMSYVIGWAPPIVLALLLNELKHLRFKKVVQSISYLPHFISTVIVVGIMIRFISVDGGIINTIIAALGRDKIVFLNESVWFRPLYIITGLWQGIGWGSIIYLAAINGIDPQLYEAASVEGANRLQQAIHITLPGITPTIVILLILGISGLISADFDKVLLMQNPVTYEVSDIVGTYIYRKGILGSNSQSYSTAIGLINSVLSLLLIMGANWFSGKVGETKLW